MKLKDFAELVNGQVLGDPDIDITGVAGIRDAGEGDVTFLASRKYIKDLATCRASCILVKDPVEGLTMAQIRVANPNRAFASAIACFHPSTRPSPVAGPFVVSEKAVVGRNVTIFPFVYISADATIGDDTIIFPGTFIGERSVIGKNCVIHANVTVREDCVLGDRIVLHSGTVIGSDGFGYVFDEGRHNKIPQVGRVVIEDDVEIGSNVSIDRATLGQTVIGRGAKIDNLVQVGHNVSIGEHSILVAQVGIGGSTQIGSYVVLAGQTGVGDHTTIESGTLAAGRTGFSGYVSKGTYAGFPAVPHMEWLRSHSQVSRLPDMNKKLKELEDRLRRLEKENSP